MHLRDLRRWREEALGGLVGHSDRGAGMDTDTVSPPAAAGAAHAHGHVRMHFPSFDVPYEELLQELEASGVPCAVSARDTGLEATTIS